MHTTRRHFLKSLGFTAAGSSFVSFLPASLHGESPRLAADQPRSTPEAQGIPSAAILDFLTALNKLGGERHSIMLARHGKIISEGWWAPYAKENKHWLYSLSKSFASTAVGLAAAEGKLSVDDLVTKHFPDDLPKIVGDNLAALRIKDLLSMTVGHASDPTFDMVKSQNWVREFLARPVKFTPGTHFVYNSGATYLCSAIVQKVTGQPLLDFLTPRLLEPLGITGATWESCPMGIHIGGWGLSVPTDALVKFGQLYLQKGKWQDRQLLTEKWVAEATSKKTQQPAPEKPSRPNEKNDWLQGYGYQFWRCQNGAYRGDGAFGQFCVVLPEQDVVMVLTGETNDMQGVLDAAWNTLLPALGSKPLAEDPAAQEKLATKLKSLVLPVVVDMQNKQAASFSGQKFRLEANPAGLEEAEVTFEGERTKLVLRDAKQEHSLESGTSKLIFSEATFPPPPRLVSGGAAKPGTKHKVAISGGWQNEKAYDMVCRYPETPHHQHIRCEFLDNKINIYFISSISRLSGDHGKHHLLLTGTSV